MKIRNFLLTAIALLLGLTSVSAYNQTNFSINTTYTVSTGVSYLFVEAWGGGGGGTAAGTNDNSGRSGGGGGAYSASLFSVTAGEVWSVFVGSAGTAGNTVNFSGGKGGYSMFNRSGTNVTAMPGSGSLAGFPNTGGIGSNASLSNGNVVSYSGGSGSNSAATYSGAGGGGAGTSSSGGTPVTNTSNLVGGTGGSLYGGVGGTAVVTDAVGNAGSTIGGGGSGAFCDSACAAKAGGAGAAGQVTVTSFNESFSYIIFEVKDIQSLAVLTTPTNITLQRNDGLVTYTLNSSTGTVAAFVDSGTYVVIVTNSAYPELHQMLTVVEDNTTRMVSYYVDSLAQATNFLVFDTLGSAIPNVSVSFSTGVNGTSTVVVQGTSDFSGQFSVNLNPNRLYSMVAVDPSGVYNNFTGSILPNLGSVTYPIQMTFSTSGVSYPSPYNNTFTDIVANYTNSTIVINVSWQVIATLGDLDWFAINATYNGTTRERNLSGNPSGGTLFVNFTNVNLTEDDTVEVTFWFKRFNYSTVTFTEVYQFIDLTPTNTSLTGGLFNPPNAPSGVAGKAILGMIIVIIIMSAVGAITGMTEVSLLAGIITIGALGNFGMFPVLFSVASVIIGSLALVAMTVNKK